MSFGQRVAEEEGDQLASYFVETDNWYRLLADAVDVVYGTKGAGKSALYSLLTQREAELFDRGVLIAAAENPRGATAFRSLVTDPPATEREFIALWKLYLACVASRAFDDVGLGGESVSELRRRLEDAGLATRKVSLSSVLHSAFEYVKRLCRPSGVEGHVSVDPLTQHPTGFSTKILFSEPSAKEVAEDVVSVDRLLELVDSALRDSDYKLWILLDRLDVAFSDSPDLEQNALRALFHVYLDLLVFKSIRLKIFLRTDIWKRITDGGFREASHITRHLTIEWNRASLLNLVVRRAVQNHSVIDHYGVTREEVLGSGAGHQEEFFYRLFPEQVEVGKQKPRTFDWMVSHTADGTSHTAPRELIHLLNSLRDVQVRRLEVGDQNPEGDRLFARQVFKEALPEVSRARLEQTLYAEYPFSKELIEKLRSEKSEQSARSLGTIWQVSPDKAVTLARQLCDVGFFEEAGDKADPRFWVPFLYRDALDLVQGAAD